MLACTFPVPSVTPAIARTAARTKRTKATIRGTTGQSACAWDSERAAKAIKGAEGKRLTYRQPCEAQS